MTMKPFTPPDRMLMGPGPSDIHERVRQAMARPTIGHLDPEFIRLMDEIKDGLQQLFLSENKLTMPISGPGSAAQEATIVNLLEPGDTVVICINGVFGGRLAEMARRAGAHVVTVEQAWGRAIDVDAVRATLAQQKDVKVLAFVHAETSTGALSDARALAALAHEFGALALADTVTSLGGVPVKVDEWGLDAVYSGTQKCLSCPPGLAPVTFSPAALKVLEARRTPVQSWFLDVSALMAYWGSGNTRSYHHTAPVNALYGLHEALVMLHEEGLEAVWARHAQVSKAFVAGLQTLGLAPAVPEAERVPELITVGVPSAVDEAAVRGALLNDHGIEIGAGLGPLAGQVWRIGLMGQSAQMDHVGRLLDALETVLAAQGVTVESGAARAAATAAA